MAEMLRMFFLWFPYGFPMILKGPKRTIPNTSSWGYAGIIPSVNDEVPSDKSGPRHLPKRADGFGSKSIPQHQIQYLPWFTSFFRGFSWFFLKFLGFSWLIIGSNWLINTLEVLINFEPFHELIDW